MNPRNRIARKAAVSMLEFNQALDSKATSEVALVENVVHMAARMRVASQINRAVRAEIRRVPTPTRRPAKRRDFSDTNPT